MHGLNSRSLLTNVSDDDDADSPPIEDERADDNNDSQSENLERRFEEDDSVFYTRLPPHRELIPPFVALYRSEDTSVMPVETDIDELLAELDDEFELDKLDYQLQVHYEKTLWQAVAGDTNT